MLLAILILAIVIWRPQWRVIGTIHFTWRAPSDGAEKAWKNRTIAVRSSRDRGRDRAAIAARSSRDRTSFAAESLLLELTMINGDPGPRSTPDRGLIVAWSWPNRGAFEEKLRLNPPLNLVQIVAELKPRRRQVKVPPWHRKSVATTRSNGQNSWANSPFKKPCISPLFLNFWSIR